MSTNEDGHGTTLACDLPERQTKALERIADALERLAAQGEPTTRLEIVPIVPPPVDSGSPPMPRSDAPFAVYYGCNPVGPLNEPPVSWTVTTRDGRGTVKP